MTNAETWCGRSVVGRAHPRAGRIPWPEGMSPWAASKGFLVPWKVGTTALGTVTPWWGPLGAGVGSDAELLKGDKADSLRLAVPRPGLPLLRASQEGTLV